MARRSDHSREELKELAIQAGLELIRTEGFGHFSARKVAAKIGYSVGTLYHIFCTYDEFILHINARTLDEWFAAMQDVVQNDAKADPIRAIAQCYINYSKTHYHEWLALFEHHMNGDAELPEWYAPKMTRFFTLVEDLFLIICNDNHEKAARSARILWAGIHGISVLSLSGKLDLFGVESAETLANEFVDSYMAGLNL